MEDLTKIRECLRDLMAFHAERIVGYELIISGLTCNEKQLSGLFDALIRQSKQMKAELQETGIRYGGDETWLMHDDSRLSSAWSVVKAVFSSRMPNYPVDKCRAGENALLIAYHAVEATDGLHNPIRLIINRQKRELIAARDWITHFAGLLDSPEPLQNQLAAVS